MSAGHRAVMPVPRDPSPAAPSAEPDVRRPVRTDLRAGGIVLVVVIGANLLWRASDAGLLLSLPGR